MDQTPDKGAPLRVSLRHVADDGAHDLVGDLVLADDERVVVLPQDRGPVTIAREAIRAMREVPPRVVRPSSSVADLSLLMAEGWPGREQVRLGGWRMVAGEGATRRANSCLPVGDPGTDLPSAVAAVTEFYTDRGLPPRFQVSYRDDAAPDVDGHLAAAGWRVVTPTVSMVCDLREVDLPSQPVDPTLTWADQPDGDWYALQDEPSAAYRGEMTSAPAWYATLHVAGEAVGGGRLWLGRDWAGLTCLVVREDLRGRGHGRALTIGMMARARGAGARFCYLQVVADNTVARRLYDSLGFTEHHRYHYREQTPRG